VGVVLQCLEWDFKYTTTNILHMDASIVSMLWPMSGIVMYTCYLKEDKSHLGCHADVFGRTNGRTDDRTMAAGASVT
jgi:hypothetical protein